MTSVTRTWQSDQQISRIPQQTLQTAPTSALAGQWEGEGGRVRTHYKRDEAQVVEHRTGEHSYSHVDTLHRTRRRT
ncbi:hypothetical protein ILYODFUR_001428 [Ilyodon furcidens]|uniref:Uncharacterized protein n=1 Tax=Ilyodon furcidens TaxID=33524 RepID=A0ABV0TR03_9TELE